MQNFNVKRLTFNAKHDMLTASQLKRHTNRIVAQSLVWRNMKLGFTAPAQVWQRTPGYATGKMELNTV